jgi:mono/diheme cytochrome c family protein
MKSFKTAAFWLSGVLIVAVTLVGVQAFAQLSDVQSITRGGRLYDDWIKELKLKTPDGNQALWASQTTNTRMGKDSYRCKECHGWDYKGKDGEYGQGSHRTGFLGVLAAQSKSTTELTAALKGSSNPKHDFSAWMSDTDLGDLVNFLKNGLLDPATLLDSSGKPFKGDAKTGAGLFTRCTACHGADGKAINFGSDAKPEFVGTVALENGWEFLHKVRMGQPATPMPAQLGLLHDAELQDLLSHAQTLPQK